MPNTFLLHARLSGPSGRTIAEALDADAGSGRVQQTVDYDYVIRWGSTATGPEAMARTFNLSSAIANAVDKLRAFDLLREAEVPVPMWSSNWRELRFPMIGRKTMRGKGGKGIVLYLQPNDLLCQTQPIAAYVQYIPKAREFRVHVAFGNVVKVSEKKYSPAKGKKYNSLIWNYRHGFVFRREVPNFDPEYGNIACDAVRSLGLDFGAVDMIEGTDGFPYVLEVNTAPGVTSPTTLNAYVQAFRSVIG